MKIQKTNTRLKKKVNEDYTINPSLQGKYDDQPVFQDKMDRANFILKKFGIPKFEQGK